MMLSIARRDLLRFKAVCLRCFRLAHLGKPCQACNAPETTPLSALRFKKTDHKTSFVRLRNGVKIRI